MTKRYIAWGRVTLLVAPFSAALAMIRWNWHAQPPLPANASPMSGRNATGDLDHELVLLTIEFLIALAALQPWTPWPRRRWIGLAGLSFGVWGVLLLLLGMHAPPVAGANMLLMLVLGVVMSCMILGYRRREDDPEYVAAMLRAEP